MTPANQLELQPEVFQGGTITFYVGTPPTEVSVHKTLLLRHSTVFAQMFRQQLNEHLPFLSRKFGGTVTMHPQGGLILPSAKFDLESMKKILNYLYRGAIPVIMESPTLVFHVYGLAIEMGIAMLADKIIDGVQMFNKTTRSLTIAEVQEVHTKFGSSGKLWEYCVEAMAEELFSGNTTKQWGQQLKQLCLDIPEVAQGLVAFQVNGDRGRQSRCKFHCHHKLDLCSQTGTENTLPVKKENITGKKVKSINTKGQKGLAKKHKKSQMPKEPKIAKKPKKPNRDGRGTAGIEKKKSKKRRQPKQGIQRTASAEKVKKANKSNKSQRPKSQKKQQQPKQNSHGMVTRIKEE